jgi:hypothetical protein
VEFRWGVNITIFAGSSLVPPFSKESVYPLLITQRTVRALHTVCLPGCWRLMIDFIDFASVSSIL